MQMKNNLLRHVTLLVAAVLLSTSFWSCRKDDDLEPAPSAISVTGVTLNKSTLSIQVGGSETLTATVAPKDASNKKVTWKSSNEAVATVANGKVTAVKAGEATITVTTADGSQSAACTVNVATPLPEPPKEELGLRSIYQNKGETINEFSTKVGSTVQMRVDGTEQTVTWTIEDTKIATVDANGLVTAVSKGKTILKATVGDQSVSCFVIVN